jgi:hypothetical protein
MSVNSTHHQYDAMQSRWQMCRDASEGEHAVHAAGERYLPKLQDETVQSYALRLSMTPFFNATWRTIAGLRGMLFRKPPMVEAPDSLAVYFDDIDLAGTSLNNLAAEVVEEVLTVGRVGVLVDYPQTESGLTLADTQAMGLRATMTIYTAESIINWRGNPFTLLVLKEQVELPSDDEFKVIYEDRYRVLDLINGRYRQRLFRMNEKNKQEQIGEEVYPQMNGKSLNFIPFELITV